ncbi:MAG: tetratricopeptide repeat protein [Candidatus Caenarcaniphilales bacterium]|nr:tetratricopeptide repeat protein [Candidatus Caenarcaniphilales bacterium]
MKKSALLSKMIRSKQLRVISLCFVLLSTTGAARAYLNPTALSYYKLALDWQRKGNASEAEKALSKALSMAPKDVDLLSHHALVLLELGERESALKELESASLLDPKNTRLRVLYAHQLQEVGKLSEAIQQYQTIAQLEPDHAAVFASLGEVEEKAGQFENAVMHLNLALREDPNNTNLRQLIADSLFRLDRLDEAIEAYNGILAIDSQAEYAYINLGRVFTKQENFVYAENAYRQALKIRPAAPDTMSAIADLQIRQKQVPQAISTMQEVIRLQPKSASAHAQLANYYALTQVPGSAYHHYELAAQYASDDSTREGYALAGAQELFKLGKYDQAGQIIEKALQKRSDDLVLKSQLADIRYWQKRYSEAVLLYQEISSREGGFLENQTFLYNFASAQTALKNWSEAEALWKRLLSKQPQSANAWQSLALGQRARHKNYDALQSLENAKNYGGSREAILNEIASLQQEIGDFAALEITYRELISLKPDNPRYLIALAKLYRKQKQIPQAIALLDGYKLDHKEIFLELGRLLIESGDNYRAANAYQKVLNLDPTNLEGLNGLADTYASIGQYEEALMFYRRILEHEPSDFHAQYNYALALANLNQTSGAIQAYEKVISLNPNYADAYYALGALLLDSDTTRTRQVWKKYLELKPNGEYAGEILYHLPELKSASRK